MDVHGARIKDNATLASHLHGFSRDHDNGAGSIMEQHHGAASLHLQWLSAKHEIGGNVEEVGYTRHVTQREI